MQTFAFRWQFETTGPEVRYVEPLRPQKCQEQEMEYNPLWIVFITSPEPSLL